MRSHVFSLCPNSHFAHEQFRNCTAQNKNSYFARQSENSRFAQDNSGNVPILTLRGTYAQAKSLFKSKQEKMAHFTKLLFCPKKNLLASNFFMQMFNESILCRQSIELFRHKLWYKLNSLHMHYLYPHTKLLS